VEAILCRSEVSLALMNIDRALYALDAAVIFFPVRHHSPAAARLLRQLIHDRQPAAILIEGPSNFNDRLHELFLPHKLPIAIYSYLHTADDRRRGAFYPFCVYSPEWN
jgi:DNA-binding LacI/PurR family transcriptional regulator